MRWPLRLRRRPRPSENVVAASPRHAAWAQPALPPVEPSVTLGFADGTEVELKESDPAALQLHAVAEVLLRQEPV